MVTEFERKLVLTLVKIKAFKIASSMRLPWIQATWGFEWLLKLLKNRQVVDNLHHAPCCPANHYCRQRLVFRPCTCGITWYAITDYIHVLEEGEQKNVQTS